MGLIDTILGALGLGGDKEPSPSSSTASPSATTVAEESESDIDDEDDDDDEDDEGWERDYDLEAKDDSANFDFDGDLEGYSRAKTAIESAWDDIEERHELFAEHGVRDEPHWYQVTATFERWMQAPATLAKYGTIGDIQQVMMNATMDTIRADMNARLQGELKGEVEPVEGVSLEQWAKAQAGIASGGDAAALIAEIGIDKAKWDRVSEEWNARMSRDTTATIATEYSKHFNSAGVGQFAGAGAAGMAAMGGGGELNEADAPIPFEKYVEIECAQACGVEQGKDAAGILKSFGMSPMEWGQVGGWWSQFIAMNAMKNDGALHKKYTDLQEKFTEKYKAGSADSDLSF